MSLESYGTYMPCGGGDETMLGDVIYGNVFVDMLETLAILIELLREGNKHKSKSNNDGEVDCREMTEVCVS